ncbi:MAG: nucleotidyl transferase AbiEii/AbiGii toxin family protein, partial [Cyclobacteriaceae bacterium]
GGTALSKCYRIIERFSEDIDLVTLRVEEETGAQLKKKLKEIYNPVNVIMPEVDLPGVTNKRGMIRKTAHEYPKAFKGLYGQVRDKVIIEASWLGHYEPYHSRGINSYIYDMMLGKEQHALIKEYEMDPFTVQVLDIKRTLCEKILSLVRFSYTENPISDLKMKIRHLYDLHQLLAKPEIQEFLDSVEFEAMLNRVGEDDLEGYRSNNDWLVHHPSEAMIFNKPEEVWHELERTYTNDFKGLVFGHFPVSDQVLSSLNVLSQRIKGISWNVKKAE